MNNEPELLPVREVLTYLPSFKGQSFAEANVLGEFHRFDLYEALECVQSRMEALGRYGVTDFFLDVDHDFVSQAFMIDKFFIVKGEGLLVEGRWTLLGIRLRPLFRGISPARIPWSQGFPPSPRLRLLKEWQAKKNEEALQKESESADSLGAICVNSPPTFPETNRTFNPPGATDNPERLMRILEAVKSGNISWPPLPSEITT